MNFLSILRLFLPPSVCALCERPADSGLCEQCRRFLLPVPVHCLSCSRIAAKAGERCGRCLQHPPPLDRLWIAAQYAGSGRDVVHLAKFSSSRSALGVMEDAAADLAPAIRAVLPDLPDAAVMAMPLSFLRLGQRGYNQCDFLAARLAKMLDLPLAVGMLRRESRPAQSQAGGAEARRKNIHGAFFVRGVPPRSVILVDDIFTTGSTLYEASRTLKQAGAEKVVGAVFAAVFE